MYRFLEATAEATAILVERRQVVSQSDRAQRKGNSYALVEWLKW
jgi:hypothetical protein